MALGAATAYAVTIASAYIYLKVLSLLASKKRLGYYEKDLAGTVNDFMATNKDIINDIMNDAKKEYKSTKK